MCGWPGAPVSAQDAVSKANPPVSAEFREPVTLASKDGVLEVRLTARQGAARLDTVATPVKNFLLFDYQVIRGTASDGQMSGGNLYPAPTLQVFPGETLIVHLENGLSDLTIRDYFSPRIHAEGRDGSDLSGAMTSSPLNLHVHGVHVSPKGNADNVLLHIPAGMSNTYTYNIPTNMPQGAYWYHSHLHGLTAAHTYMGLAGLLAIGRTDGNLPLVTQNSIPVRNMLLQYNFVFDRANGLAQLNNPYWPQFVSSITPPQGDELAKGTYRPLLAPVNFNQSKPGEKYFTVWYAGPLSIQNQRGRFQFIPSNLQRFTAHAGGPTPVFHRSVASRLSARRAVHGQRPVPAGHQEQGRPDRDLGARQRQRHRLHQRSADGNGNRAAPQDRHRRPGRKSLSGRPLSRHRRRHAAAHSAGQPVRDRRDDSCGRRARARDAAARGGAKTITAPGVLYTNNGTDNPPACWAA